uniref:Uncharacterized protein n=1 Tax=virus sp. ctrcb4 TaxID=2825824 RepID=A0A8S5RQ88_9VIRU|nr:MAG TPA: hypothetical protein [virus sp. ctrcb4]
MRKSCFRRIFKEYSRSNLRLLWRNKNRVSSS